ncbi:tyrosine phosphatase [Colletotrichum graminicola]|uniref:Tyrosine phosphatase n=1 Tax=Colletotrichum graminicola (strain M1.001 / M2 / FGSC 10212) TaxID=645133 RepID=E3QK75_COLGM|nr:tyrosine phosphatase [Colletotrichum graminicola M1.001]EFQ31263.1 tyrosine phosphatase [Colletotrichum graminicola M1.001]WDK19269.1 tyrosine phosphatase [Colletotrichum graminicola]
MLSHQEYPASKLLEIAATDVRSPLQQSDYAAILSRPPFHCVPGTFNTRDIGQVPGSAVRPGLAFRSGSLEAIGEPGAAVIAKQLGVRRIFDLRSGDEREKYPEPEIPGVANDWIPTPYNNKVDMNDFASGGGEEGYCKMYMGIMEVYAPTFKAILEHVRDRPEEPFLFHCALGRDRTGIVAEMLLFLAGSDEDTLTLDYMMTRIGSEPLRDVLLERAVQDNGAVNGLEDPTFQNLCNLRASTWELFVKQVKSQYGGFDGYVTGKLGFSKEDLEVIRKNLRG